MTAGPGTDASEAADQAQCEHCGSPILWAESEKGNWVPLDPTPVPPDEGGTFSLDNGTAHYVPKLYRVGGELFRFHGLTCSERRNDRAGGTVSP